MLQKDIVISDVVGPAGRPPVSSSPALATVEIHNQVTAAPWSAELQIQNMEPSSPVSCAIPGLADSTPDLQWDSNSEGGIEVIIHCSTPQPGYQIPSSGLIQQQSSLSRTSRRMPNTQPAKLCRSNKNATRNPISNGEAPSQAGVSAAPSLQPQALSSQSQQRHQPSTAHPAAFQARNHALAKPCAESPRGHRGRCSQ